MMFSMGLYARTSIEAEHSLPLLPNQFYSRSPIPHTAALCSVALTSSGDGHGIDKHPSSPITNAAMFIPTFAVGIIFEPYGP